MADEPVLDRVLLSSSGVGWFGYRAAPEADGSVRLRVPLRQVDDILKSLTILDGERVVRAVSLPGPAPLADVFREAPFGEDDLGDLPALLRRLRGAEVEIQSPVAIRGRILSLAREEVATGETVTARHRLSIATEQGIQSVILEDVRGITLIEPDLQRQLSLVLTRLAESRHEQDRELVISLGGGTGGELALGYLVEVPLWKASYRLVLRAGDGLLQGWAIIENVSGRDWRDVDVALIAGAPTALRQALFQIYFVPRPEVPVLPGPAELPLPSPMQRSLGGPFAKSMADGAGAAEMAAASRAAPPARLGAAAAQELTAQALYHLPQKVTLATGHTAMAPLVDAVVPVERIARYRAGERARHPKAALHLRNTTGASLPDGLATAYEQLPEGGLTFAGDIALPRLAPGASELVDYAVDGSIVVTVEEERQGRVDRVRIADGVMELARVEQQRERYAIVGSFTGAPRRFVLDRPRLPGWNVAEPGDAVIENDAVRVTRELAPEGRLTIVLVLERPVVERVELGQLDAEALLLQFRGLTPPPEVRAVIERLQGFSARLTDIDRQIEAASGARSERIAEQERLRENLAAVPRESDLAQRYLNRLGESEDELSRLAATLDQLRVERDRVAGERLSYLRGLRL